MSDSVPETEIGRWHAHGWNRDLSWRLIRGIIPRVPRILRPPIHALTTLVCFASMPRERRAARRNLTRITGRSGLPSLFLALRLFYNFSKFMVGYTDLAPFRPELVEAWAEGRPEAQRAIAALIAEGKGLIVLTLHLGNWEIGLALLSRLGTPVNVVLRQGEGPGPARFADEARAHPGVRIVAAGDSAWNGLDLLLALRRGEIVAIQGDRPFGDPTRRVALFGAPVTLPAGPFALAQASGASILLVCCPIRGHFRYRFHVGEPLRVAPGEEGLQTAMDEFARGIERVVASYPTQWFNFYDVWKEGRPGVPAPADPSCPAR